MSIHALVVETPRRRIIVDTCLGNDKEGRRIPGWNRLQTQFLADLAAAGYPRETIDTVVCTHLHVDHVGWNTMLRDGKWLPTFPRARYLMGRTEFAHWLLSDHMQDLVDGYVDQLLTEHEAAPDGVVDLHAGLAFPLPVAVICRLLGVPENDREYFASLSERMANYAIGDEAHRAREEFNDYMAGLAETKRARQDEDVISDLVRAQSTDEDYDYAEMIRLCVGLLFAGHETTVNRIGLGTLFLLTRPDHWQALTADPAGRVNATIEEIMRLGAPGDLGLLRYAHTDVDVAGVTIQRGDAVILSVNAANRDASVYTDAETFNPDRPERTHLGFGHGAHFCIGASLARTELRIVFATLARRLPGLRLAKALDELQVRTTLTGGVTELPVTW